MLMQVAEPDQVILHRRKACPHWRTKLEAVVAEKQVKRQVFDTAPASMEVTEHRAVVKQCPGCGACVKGALPAHVTQPSQYGPGLRALACYLYGGQQLIPLAGITELLSALCGDAASEAVAVNAAGQLAMLTRDWGEEGNERAPGRGSPWRYFWRGSGRVNQTAVVGGTVTRPRG